jgi:undecaprenyl diphosphate synthase
MEGKIPYHIAVIMDGNGRWAREHGLPRPLGHKEGIQRVREIVRTAKDFGVKIVTIFAFSSENWSRSPDEVNTLFFYMKFFLGAYQNELMEQGVKLNMVGRRDRIDKGALAKLEEIERVTADNKGVILNIALDYGGRWDIVQAAQKIARECVKGNIVPDAVEEDILGKFLALAGMPDPDLLIRTSGEQRISNFLLWQCAYSEFYFCEKNWPDFDKNEFKKALDEYASRARRFGKA